jgi:hypothetical protein
MFRSYRSFDEMVEDMHQAEERANAQLHPEQIALRDAVDETRYWVSPDREAGVLIFGEAWSKRQNYESAARWAPDYPLTPGPQADAEHLEELDEPVSVIRTYDDARTRGYLFGTAYSVVEPEGELGSTHVYNAWPISKEAFEEARAHGWQAITVPQHLQDAPGLRKSWTPTLVQELEEIGRAVRAWEQQQGEGR